MAEFHGYFRVIFSRFPDAPHGDTQFVELEDYRGHGVGSAMGSKWVENKDTGYVELHIPHHPAMPSLYQRLKEARDALGVLDEGTLGYEKVFSPPNSYKYPLLHELLHHVDDALALVDKETR